MKAIATYASVLILAITACKSAVAWEKSISVSPDGHPLVAYFTGSAGYFDAVKDQMVWSWAEVNFLDGKPRTFKVIASTEAASRCEASTPFTTKMALAFDDQSPQVFEFYHWGSHVDYENIKIWAVDVGPDSWEIISGFGKYKTLGVGYLDACGSGMGAEFDISQPPFLSMVN